MAKSKGGETVASAGVWALRSIVVGSSVASIWHLAPIVWDSSASNTVTLAMNPDAYFAREGIRRLSRQARWGPKRRRLLLKHGAVSALAGAATHPDDQVRDTALGALKSFSYNAHDTHVCPARDARVPPARLLGFKGISEALVADDCGSGCQRLWSMFLDSEAERNSNSRDERVNQLYVLSQGAKVNTAGVVEESVITQAT